MIKLSRTFILASVGLLALTSMAAAQEEEGDWLPGELSGNVAFYSDYSFRGVSQTGENLALQGGIDWAHDSGVYLGLWASNVDFADADIEQDVYGGYAGSVDAFSYDLGVVFFYYPQEEELNYWEFPLNLGYDFDVASISFGVLFSPEYFGLLDEGVVVSGGLAVPIPLELPGIELGFDANIGYSNANGLVSASDDDYVDWSVGLTVGLPKGLGVDLRGVGTDEDDIAGFESSARFVAGLTYSF